MRSDAPKAQTEDLFKALSILGLMVAALAAYGVLYLGVLLSRGTGPTLTEVVQGLIGGGFPWSIWHPVLAVLLVGGVAGVVVLAARRLKRRRAEIPSVDKKARYMGTTEGLGREAAIRKAEEGDLGVVEKIGPGLFYGHAIRDDAALFTDWRGTVLVEMGTGGGKTTGVAIPFVLDAPGDVVVTGNKRDVPDAVREACAERGEFWCFDPSRIADYHGDVAPFWWDPLRDIKGPNDALVLATILAEAAMPANATKHPYFDTRGPSLLAYLLLAAKESGRDITDVYEWLNDPEDDEPMKILKGKGHRLPSRFLFGIYHSTDGGERSGLFGTAANAVEFLTDPEIQSWVTDEGTGRMEFVPEEFVDPGKGRRDTLCLLSQKGDGAATALTTALMVFTTRAAERLAKRRGRLPIPLVMVLDEVANVTPWKRLPEQFSYFGSSGLTLVAIFQNYAQGVAAWGPEGMKQIWNAANYKIIGGGLADREHLNDVAQLVGERHVWRRTASSGGDRVGSTSTGTEKELILSVDELAALGRDKRFVMIPASGYPILGRLVPWHQRPGMAPVVLDSLRLHKPELS